MSASPDVDDLDEVHDCRRCGHPVYPGARQPCEEGGLCSPDPRS